MFKQQKRKGNTKTSKDAKYREPDNNTGRDAKLSQILPHIPNVDFKNIARNHFGPSGAFGNAPYYLLPE